MNNLYQPEECPSNPNTLEYLGGHNVTEDSNNKCIHCGKDMTTFTEIKWPTQGEKMKETNYCVDGYAGPFTYYGYSLFGKIKKFILLNIRKLK